MNEALLRKGSAQSHTYCKENPSEFDLLPGSHPILLQLPRLKNLSMKVCLCEILASWNFRESHCEYPRQTMPFLKTTWQQRINSHQRLCNSLKKIYTSGRRLKLKFYVPEPTPSKPLSAYSCDTSTLTRHMLAFQY